MKKITVCAAASALMFGGNIYAPASIQAAGGHDVVEECRALFDEFGGDQPFGDCVEAMSGGQSPASTCRIFIFLGWIPASEFDECVVTLTRA